VKLVTNNKNHFPALEESDHASLPSDSEEAEEEADSEYEEEPDSE
jgi:hypothetical protein